jgi:ligand-binding sensor domain-containing protein/signal transduction histidine kinase
MAAMRRHAFWLSLLLLATGLDVRAERLAIKAYTTDDGLAHNDVRRIVRDSRGFLWFCTAEGLSRFDGYTFRNFGLEQGLPHASINDLIETADGHFWIATGGGLVRFDPKGTPDRRVVSVNEVGASTPMFAVVPHDGPPRARATTVVRQGRDSTLWVGTLEGLYRLVNANARLSLEAIEIGLPADPEGREINDVLEDATGSLWIAAPSGLYRRWPDGTAARYTEEHGLPHRYMHELFRDRRGQLWGGTRLAGFFRFHADHTGRAPTVDLAFTFPELPTTWVSQLYETDDGRLWVASVRGLAELIADGDRHQVRAYGPPNGMTDHNITTIAEDLGGNLWLGTASSGAMKFTRGGFRTFGRQDGIVNLAAVFDDRSGHVCFRANLLGDAERTVFEGAKVDLLQNDPYIFHTRLGCFDGQRFDWFNPAGINQLTWGWVMEHLTLQARNGEWWIGTGRGLYRYPSSGRLNELRTARPVAIYTEGLASAQVFKIFEDSRGRIWTSTFGPALGRTGPVVNGLARLEPGDAQFRDITHSPGLPSFRDDRPRAFGEDRAGNVWMGFNEGVVRHDNRGFRWFTERDGLSAGAVREVHLDRAGRLWLATAHGGLVRVDNPSSERPTFAAVTTAQGLSSNRVEVIVEDVYGRLYVGSTNGIDRFNPATGAVKHFSVADGLTPGTLLAAFRDRDGVLWFGMSNGLAKLVPEPEKASAAPVIVITGLRVGGDSRLVSALGEREMRLSDLAPSQNQVQVDFVALGFGLADVLRYQYRFDATGAEWSAPSELRTVNYASLSPGRYRFAVRAVNADGIASTEPAMLSFRILPPMWQRWWFLASGALLVGIVVHRLYRYRVARLLEIANMRAHIATDLHDDIGANLTRIALLSEVAKQTPGDGPLMSIARIARESVGSMSDIVWAINPNRESLLDLTRRMRQHAEEVFTLREIALRFNVPDAPDTVKLGMDLRRDLLLVFKEAVNNAARHSQCTLVEIDLQKQDSRLILTVADNGKGFDPSAESAGQGVVSMRRRAERLRATITITPPPSGGTAVRLDIPIGDVGRPFRLR